MSVDPNYEVKPGFQKKLWIFVPQNLETMGIIAKMAVLLLPRLRVEAGNETIEGAKHSTYFSFEIPGMETKH